MNANEYQQLAARTLIDEPDSEYTPLELMIAWNAIGLAGEAGEINELVKKGIFHRHGLDREKMAKELGDCLWYIAALCTKLGLDMSEIMEANIEKLKERYPDGYSSAASKARVDVAEETLDWDKAKDYLSTAIEAYRSIGSSGVFALNMTIYPLQDRYVRGERTEWLYNDIMEIAL